MFNSYVKLTEGKPKNKPLYSIRGTQFVCFRNLIDSCQIQRCTSWVWKFLHVSTSSLDYEQLHQNFKLFGLFPKWFSMHPYHPFIVYLHVFNLQNSPFAITEVNSLDGIFGRKNPHHTSRQVASAIAQAHRHGVPARCAGLRDQFGAEGWGLVRVEKMQVPGEFLDFRTIGSL